MEKGTLGRVIESHRKAGLQMTAQDHINIGGTPEKVLTDNPGKTLAETMDDATLNAFITKQVADVAEQHQRAQSGDMLERRIFGMQLNNFLAPNIAYLREIGRLPAELTDIDLVKKFAL